jgi:hypothetical protein
MTDNLQILREAGFFKEYAMLSEDQLLETLRQKEKEKYSEIFGYEYEPARNVDLNRIAAQDNKKFLDIDLEADVCAENKVYTRLLGDFANASNGHFLPTDIKEVWSSDQGPISVTFISNGQNIVFEPEYNDDWIDGRLFEIINNEIKQVSNEGFVYCSGPNDEWMGQNIVLIRLTENEKSLLKEKLDWNFPEHY